MDMYCYQCEQTAKGIACTAHGVCGKEPDVAALQDLLVHAVQGVAMVGHRARLLGRRDDALDAFVLGALFATVTNVNFDADRLADLIHEAAAHRDRARHDYETACRALGQTPDTLAGPAAFVPAADRAALLAQAADASIPTRQHLFGDAVAGLQDLLLFGLKGTAAYAHHARLLGGEDQAVYDYFLEALDFLADPHPTADALVPACLRCGEVNLRVMELLDAANTGAYGHPEPTRVRVTPVAGKAILVSGHDLKDLDALLRQTAGRGVNVYTHGEMLPALAYPGLKKYPHLVGNYGGAWQDQQKEFDAFPGAILMTTNCIQKPRPSYMDRIFTCGPVAWPGVTHLAGHDFEPLIRAALAAPGFAADEPEKLITIGFGHQAVLGVADKVIEAVKAGAIRHFYLIGGCDGAKSGRNYYTEFAQATPPDTVILTLACGKYRFNKLDFGDIGGIPRLLDIGQCNDAYSAIRIAAALADAFGTDVNGLPLSFILSWYEQKAVCILLTLLHLGIKNIKLGPSLPAFVRPPVLDVLVSQFGLAPIADVATDLGN